MLREKEKAPEAAAVAAGAGAVVTTSKNERETGIFFSRRFVGQLTKGRKLAKTSEREAWTILRRRLQSKTEGRMTATKREKDYRGDTGMQPTRDPAAAGLKRHTERQQGTTKMKEGRSCANHNTIGIEQNREEFLLKKKTPRVSTREPLPCTATTSTSSGSKPHVAVRVGLYKTRTGMGEPSLGGGS